MLKLTVLFALIFTLAPMKATAKTDPLQWEKAPPGYLHILPYKYFMAMPSDQKALYIKTIRGFLFQQEMKWHGKQLGEFPAPLENFFNLFAVDQAQAADPPDLVNPFGDTETSSAQPAAPISQSLPASSTASSSALFDAGDCSGVLKNLPPSFSNFIKGGQDKCLIGGYLVCLNYTGGHLRCTASDPAFQKFAQSECKGQPGSVPCAAPFYMTDDGKPLCVPLKSPNGALQPISPKCESQSDLDKLVKNFEKDPQKYAKQYETYQKQFEAYCGKDGTNAHYFDVGDCKALQTRLDKIKSLYKSVDDGVVCHRQFTAEGKALDLKLLVNEKTNFKLQVTGDANDWIVTQCNDSGSPGLPIKANTNFSPGSNWAACVAREDKSQNPSVIESINLGGTKNDCKPVLTKLSRGKVDSVGNCEAMVQGKKFTYSAGKAYVSNMDGKDRVALTKDKNWYEIGNGSGDNPKLFYDPANKNCVADYQKTLDSTDLLPKTHTVPSGPNPLSK